ncbi:MAG: hypothetical protein WDN01_14565 [Rhizomicrobium sp.]
MPDEAHRSSGHAATLHDFLVRQARKNQKAELFSLGVADAGLGLAWDRLRQHFDVEDRLIDIGALKM